MGLNSGKKHQSRQVTFFGKNSHITTLCLKVPREVAIFKKSLEQSTALTPSLGKNDPYN